ncbi:hypothetical protein THAOC_31323, partial [Thalassiosira oceanica]
ALGFLARNSREPNPSVQFDGLRKLPLIKRPRDIPPHSPVPGTKEERKGMSGNDKKDDPKGGAASSAAPPPAPSAVEAIEEDDEFEEFEPCQWSGQDEDAEDSQQWQVRGGSGSPGPCSPPRGGGDARTRGRAEEWTGIGLHAGPIGVTAAAAGPGAETRGGGTPGSRPPVFRAAPGPSLPRIARTHSAARHCRHPFALLVARIASSLGRGSYECCHGIRGFGRAQSSSTRHQTHSAISVTRSSSCIAAFSGQTCPLVSLGAVLDVYGANLAAVSLPGHGHSRPTINMLQALLQSMMKLGGISSKKEAVNFLIGKVQDVHIARYVHHLSGRPSARKSPHAVVPGIHVYNYPADRQPVNDSGSTSASRRTSTH